MMRPRTWLLLAGLGMGTIPGRAPAAEIPAATKSEVTLLGALATNPVTAPYRFTTTIREGRVILSGRVGTKQAHDVAVRIAIDLGVRFADELVIDTLETARAAIPAQVRVPSGPLSGPGGGPVAGPVGGPMIGYGQMTGTYPYPPPTYGLSAAGPGFLYPMPLFGRYDDPFWGFEPPVISYPTYWGALSNRRLAESAPVAAAVAAPAPAPAPGDALVSRPVEVGPSPSAGTVEMVIDPLGVAKLVGVVPTLADRIAVGQRLAQTPGITRVINLLTVRDDLAQAQATNPSSALAAGPPPPPPSPAPAPAPTPAQPAGGIVVDAVDPSGSRLAQALTKRPDLAGLPIRATVRDGVAYLSGRVPTAYEAMLAYRAAQQLPGIRGVDDRLEFSVPDGEHKNPLLQKGRPEDVEPYVEAQVRRQVGDQAHVDRVRLKGDRLEVRGTVPAPDDLPRVEAILRSMPLLRGFQVDPGFVPE